MLERGILTCRNGFGILTATGGAKLVWWVSHVNVSTKCSATLGLSNKIDPLGATLIALTIMTVWTRTMYGE